MRIDAKVSEVSRQEVITAIAGEEAAELVDRHARPPREATESTRPVTVAVDGLRTGALTDVTLRAHSGRVLGIYGLVGSGRTELLRTLVGLDPVKGGKITLFDKPFTPRGPHDAMKAGVVYVTEERKTDGIVPQLDSSLNAMLPVLTVIGLQVGGLLAGAVLTETVFGFPGLGQATAIGFAQKDYPVLEVLVLAAATTFVVVNMIVDLLYAVIDPRIRTR